MTCRLQDLAGYGVAVATSKVFADAFSDRIFKSPLLDLLIKSGRNGNSGSMCFFFYNNSYFLCTGNILCEYNQLFLTLAISALPGKNNGKGYYIYEKGGKPKPDPSILPIIEESRRLCNIMPNGKVVLFGSDIKTPIYISN